MDDFSQGKESSSELSASDMLCQEVYFADGMHFFLCNFVCTLTNFYAFANADSLLAFGLQYHVTCKFTTQCLLLIWEICSLVSLLLLRWFYLAP